MPNGNESEHHSLTSLVASHIFCALLWTKDSLDSQNEAASRRRLPYLKALWSFCAYLSSKLSLFLGLVGTPTLWFGRVITAFLGRRGSAHVSGSAHRVPTIGVLVVARVRSIGMDAGGVGTKQFTGEPSDELRSRVAFAILIARVPNHLTGQREQLIPSGKKSWDQVTQLSSSLIDWYLKFRKRSVKL